MTAVRHQHQVCYLRFKDIAHMQNHDVFWYSNQVEYRHQTLGHTSETYSVIHLACNKNRPLLSSHNKKNKKTEKRHSTRRKRTVTITAAAMNINLTIPFAHTDCHLSTGFNTLLSLAAKCIFFYFTLRNSLKPLMPMATMTGKFILYLSSFI